MRNRLYTILLIFTTFYLSVTAQLRINPDGVKLDRTIRLIKDLYVDDVDSEKLTEAAIRSMLKELDPHI